MGYIKGRFASLRGLRQQIDNELDHKRAIAWIKACIIIHTIVFIIENGDEDPDYVAELVEEGKEKDLLPIDNTIQAEAVRETRGKRMREELKAHLFAYLGEREEDM